VGEKRKEEEREKGQWAYRQKHLATFENTHEAPD